MKEIKNSLGVGDFEFFQRRCRFWLNAFQLPDWELDIAINHDIEPSFFARGKHFLKARRSYIEIAADWTNCQFRSLTHKELDDTARHEIIHIFFTLPEDEAVIRLTRLLNSNRAEQRLDYLRGNVVK